MLQDVSVWLSFALSFDPCLNVYVCGLSCVSPGRLRGPPGLLEEWCQLLVWDHQLGGGLRSLRKTGGLHQSGELYRLDQFSDQTQTQGLSAGHVGLNVWHVLCCTVAVFFVKVEEISFNCETLCDWINLTGSIKIWIPLMNCVEVGAWRAFSGSFLSFPLDSVGGLSRYESLCSVFKTCGISGFILLLAGRQISGVANVLYSMLWCHQNGKGAICTMMNLTFSVGIQHKTILK